MNGFLTNEHEQLRHQVREFADNEVAPRVAAMEASRGVECDLSRMIARQGWIGATIDPVYGGMGAGHLAKTVIDEELSRVDGAMGAMAQASQLGAAPIIHFGSEKQKQTYLPAIADGSCLPTIVVTEPGSGSHVLGMESTARRSGKDYLLTGRKVFVGNSHIGDLHCVVMRTGKGSRGLSAFLVESDRPGLALTPHRPALGLHGFSFGEIIFDNCRIPVGNRLGEEGDGQAVAYSSSVLYGRPNLTAVSLGIHQALMDVTVPFALDRRRYNGPLSDLPTIKQKIARMQSRLMTARTLAYSAVHLLDRIMTPRPFTDRAVHPLDRVLPCDAELMNAKLVNVESAIDSARTAMEIHGAAALQTDRPLERLLRDVFHPWAPAGTSDIQLLRLAETALGANRQHEQWSTRLAPTTSARTVGTPTPA